MDTNQQCFPPICKARWFFFLKWSSERFIQEFEDNKGGLSETVNKKTCSDQKVNGQKDNNEWTPRSTGSELKFTGRVSKSWYSALKLNIYLWKSVYLAYPETFWLGFRQAFSKLNNDDLLYDQITVAISTTMNEPHEVLGVNSSLPVE
jgi:hypothetical protein